MNSSPGAPRLLRRFLGRTLPADVRDGVLGDLDEVYARTRQTRGAFRAHLWYARETFAFVARFAVEGLRDPDGTTALPVSWLDVKLGLRMLVRYPGLTLVGFVALALGVAFAVGISASVHAVMNPRFHHPDADRIVTIVNVDAESSEYELRSIRDVEQWRELDGIGAFSVVASTTRNLTGDVAGEALGSALVNADLFDIWGTPAMIGRTLERSDEAPSAPPVAVISYDTWTARFASDPDVVGREVEMDGEPVTLVGVMPDGFRFPSTYHIWEPFRLDPLRFGPREGPTLRTIALLRPGVSAPSVQHALDASAARMAELHPDTHRHLRPRVMPYPRQFTSPTEISAAYAIQGMLALLLLLVCADVGLLILARTLARTSELAVRSALGASRRRIIAQLFVETLVLSSVAAFGGLLIAARGLAVFESIVGPLPAWIDLGLGAGDFAFAGGLAIMAALVSGVVPGLKATGRSLAIQLQRATAGVVGARFGLGSHVLVTTQVFFSFCLLAGAAVVARGVADFRPERIDLPLSEYQAAYVRLNPEMSLGERLTADAGDVAETAAGAVSALDDPARAAFGLRRAEVMAELGRAIGAEPGVTDVAFGSAIPFTDHGARFVEVEGLEEHPAVVVRRADVSTDFFDTFGATLLDGRRLDAYDTVDPSAVVVTEAFGRRVMAGGSPLGRRFRYIDRRGEPTGEWFRIEGVVSDLWTLPDPTGELDPAIYHPLDPTEAEGWWMVARVPDAADGTADGTPQRLRALATAIDPALTLSRMGTLQDFVAEEQVEIRTIFAMVVGGFAAVLLLSLSGLYAVVSFTVTRRTREIGLRTALGSPRWRTASVLVRRVAIDVAAGVAAGWGFMATMARIDDTVGFPGLPWVAAAVVAMALATSWVPTARGLRVRPSEALRAEG